MVRSSTRSALAPQRLCSIHGQMEFDHILLCREPLDAKEFILLDPRGIETLSDQAYDVGEIWQSCRSMVDLLELEQFDVNFKSKDLLLAAYFNYRSIVSRGSIE